MCKGKAVFGVFRRRSELDSAKSDLENNGFPVTKMALMYPPRPQNSEIPYRTMILRGALIGGAVGGVVMLILGLLVNIGVIPVYNSPEAPVTLANQMLVILGSLIAGTVFGSASGALIGIGTPKPAGDRFGDYAEEGGILISIHVDTTEEGERAKTVLGNAGAQDVALMGEDQAWKIVYDKLELTVNASPA